MNTITIQEPDVQRLIIDTETTGFHAQEDRICEIAVLGLTSNHNTYTLFHSHINPERELSEGASKVNGLTWDSLKASPTFTHIQQSLIRILAGSELIIHNAAFDIGFLDAEIARLIPYWAGLHRYAHKITCTRALAKAKHPGISASLNSLADHYRIDRQSRGQWNGQTWEGAPHSALDDCLLLAQVYQKLQETHV